MHLPHFPNRVDHLLQKDTKSVIPSVMNLRDYIRQIGPDEFAIKFGVTKRAALAWLYGQRIPRPATAKRIVAKSPVTWAGIAGEERSHLAS
jgi:hypothetical protein